jgi:hypothetical protein
MSMVEVRHRASEALQKPSLHETARHESRLWIFDPVSSRAAKRKQETNAPRRPAMCFAMLSASGWVGGSKRKRARLPRYCVLRCVFALSVVIVVFRPFISSTAAVGESVKRWVTWITVS